MTCSACAAASPTTARCSGERNTTKRQACALAPEGAHIAACRQRSRVASCTGSSGNRRIVRAVDIASHTSLVASAAIATPFRFAYPEENLLGDRSGARRALVGGGVRIGFSDPPRRHVLAVGVVPVPPFVGLGLRIALRGVLPDLLPAECRQ